MSWESACNASDKGSLNLNVATVLVLILTALFSLWVNSARAAITVTVAGPGGQVSQALPDAGGAFDVNLPLNRNAVNNITVTAADDQGNTASRKISVTQVSLEQIVVSQVTSERLSVEEVEQLVADGVIDLEDPENYNVSTFNIVLTIDQKPVPISIPIAVPVNNTAAGGSETYRMPKGGSGGRPDPPPVQIVVFDVPFPSPPGAPGPSDPSIPGVIIIEGNIKSLKEFFNVRLLLMNTSGIFTLSNVIAEIVLPEGALSDVLPADGINSFGDILPGSGDQPGQKEKEFIIRGDTIGDHTFTVNFGGVVTGPGITEPIPFNGSAESNVEVKGPPALQVQVSHPDSVVAGVPYDLVVEITNTGEVPAMYASLELSVDADAQIYFCEAAAAADDSPVCQYGDGPAIRSFGHILPGATVSATFSIMPSISGYISSCMAVADQNIDLQVLVGTIGCVVGRIPPGQKTADGVPTVTVVPAPNAFGIHEDAPVVAFFSERMNEQTILTGEGGTFNVFTGGEQLVPGQIRFETMNQGTDHEKTVAIWQVHDGITNRLASNAAYTIVLSPDIQDLDSHGLSAKYQSDFKTTDTGINDTTPPAVTLSVQPPVNPNMVLPGQIININAYASDQGSGVSRVELRLKDLDEQDATFDLVGQQSVFAGDLPPFIFSVDSAKLTAGHSYQAMATAYDGMGNAQNATISLIILTSAAPPVVTLPADLPGVVLHGISVTLTPEISGGVNRVEYFLDGAAAPYKTVTLAPWQATLSTLGLNPGGHAIRVLATDGLNQTGETTYDFTLAENINVPTVGFKGVTSGAAYTTDTPILITGTAEDPVGIEAIRYYLDDTGVAPIYTGFAPIVINASDLSIGSHTVYIQAENRLGMESDLGDAQAAFTFSVVDPPPGPPPAAPSDVQVSYPADGLVTVSGTSIAGARVDITNTDLGIATTVYADTSGAFTGEIPAEAGQTISLRAYDLSTSPDPSEAASSVVTAAPVLLSITASPAAMIFDTKNQTRAITVTGHYDSGPDQDLAAQAQYASSDPAVAAVDSAGTVAALSAGDAAISVSVGGFTSQVAVAVNIVELTGISVAPQSILMVTPGQTAQLSVTEHYSDGSSQTVTNGLTFITGNPQVATVNSSGLVTAVANGSTQVSVSYPGAPALAVPITVDTGQDPPPTISILSPQNGGTVERSESVSVVIDAADAFGGIRSIFMDVNGASVHTDSRQISPPSLAVTDQFQFSVASDAPMGGTITVRVWAEDTSGNTSDPAEIDLTVVDQTAPAVTITQPAQQAPYNYGDTVTIQVQALDAGEINQIRFETSGALVQSGHAQVSGTSAAADFSFDIPIGVTEPQVRIQAWATDVHGNEGASAPVDIIITDADITAPETAATAVSDPGGSAVATVTYEVADGFDDLDHVELYFRRNGIGTFNRYTSADGSGRGRYTPQNGSSGTILFDSTRMGGDGYYEFFTVGVDIAGNREAPPDDGSDNILPDQTVSFAAGTTWTVIDSDTQIETGDTFFDNQNIRIDGATVTVAGNHSFHNVELINGAVLTHGDTTAATEYQLDISVWSLMVDANSSRIDVTGRGYIGGKEYDEYGRTQENAYGSSNRAGGSYGGLGGVDGSVMAGDVYGSLTDPTDLGSGGGAHGSTDGGDGGGLIFINAINLIVDGSLNADGGESSGDRAGDGSGGGINIVTRTLSGQGFLTVNGGGENSGVGGGGGRIAVRYLDMATMDINRITALGGDGYYGNGANGTVYLKQEEEADGAILITGRGPDSPWTNLTIPNGYSFDTVTLSNQARVIADDPIAITGTLLLTGDSILSHSQGNENGLSIEAATVQVDEGSAIDVSGRGYRSGTGYNERGHTLGDIEGAFSRAGGSYGGQGAGNDNQDSFIVYGDPKQPDELGSGGGAHGSTDGGGGGGRISITATDAVIVNGAVRANGGESAGDRAGDGSGGAILIHTSRIAGTGAIEANGGGSGNGTAGGGGRVAIYCDYVDPADDLADLYNITALAGHGYYDTRQASAGSVYIKYSNQENGDLYIDDNLTDATAAQSTPLPHVGFGTAGVLSDQNLDGVIDTLTTDGLVRMLPNGLVGLRLNPDTNQDQSFVILGNTDFTITVATPNENNVQFADVADEGDTYVGSFTYDNLTFRRGGNLMTGDRLEVTGTLAIDEYGLLTHFDATTTFISRLDLSVGNLVIEETGRIDVTGRGYIGGKEYDEYGRTQENAYGSSNRAGGSYGGLGGVDGSVMAGDVYGSLTDPTDLGSGGGAHGSTDGGDGGGLIFISATDMTVNGVIRSDGGESAGDRAGDGSGGTVNIVTSSLAGSGAIEADGGGQNSGVGGGGGRIAIVSDTVIALPVNHITAHGGDGYYGSNGQPGSVAINGVQQ